MKQKILIIIFKLIESNLKINIKKIVAIFANFIQFNSDNAINTNFELKKNNLKQDLNLIKQAKIFDLNVKNNMKENSKINGIYFNFQVL